jgi:hypothetical protein
MLESKLGTLRLEGAIARDRVRSVNQPSKATSGEDLTLEELNATEPLIYRSDHWRIEVLRATILAVGIKRVARATIGVSPGTIQRFVGGTVVVGRYPRLGVARIVLSR